MPVDEKIRERHEQKAIIGPLQEDGWEHYIGEDARWVRSQVPESLKLHVGQEFKYKHYHGDTYVYKVTSTVHGKGVHVFRKLKSDYHETTPEQGTCPNCQSYVKRYDDDDYLTCHRCGWQYKPLRERLKNLF